MKLIDVHAHLTDERFEEDFDDVVLHLDEGGVQKVINAGTSFSTSSLAVELTKGYDCFFATVGIHPECVTDFLSEENLQETGNSFFIDADVKKGCKTEKFLQVFEEELSKIETLAKESKVVAIGEIGLDYFYLKDMTDVEKEIAKKLQKLAFEKQIELANKLNLPIVVHSRDAMGDTIDILKKISPKKPSLLHCYSGSLESAKELMKMGFSFSFGGVVTFKNAKNVQEVVKNLPLESILLETDCPYMSPEPFRGKRNEPKNVVYVADQIAKLKGISLEEVAKVTTENAERLFALN